MQLVHNRFGKLLATVVLLANTTVAGPNEGSDNVRLLGNVNAYASATYADVWGYTSPAGREYALLAVTTGTSIIDITEPGFFSEVAFISSGQSPWKDIKTFGDVAYVVTDRAATGLQIIDLSEIDNGKVTTKVYTEDQFLTSHNIFIDEENAMLYAESSRNEPVRAISLADPLNPVQLSKFGVDCHDIFARDNIVYVSEGGRGSVGVYNLTDPANPQFIQEFFIPSGGYSHNSWMTDDSRYLITTEESVGKTVKMWDVSNLENVSITAEFLGESQLAHNVVIKGDYAYVSHYADGLRILDIRDPNNLVETGYYDTFSGKGSYVGAWGVYPFLKSGKVLVSDISSGLYVFYFEGALEKTTDVEAGADLPDIFTLEQNYPNPFNPETTVPFRLADDANVRIQVFDITGRAIRTLLDAPRAAGSYEVQWDGRDDTGIDAASGVYFTRMTAISGGRQIVRTRQAVLVR